MHCRNAMEDVVQQILQELLPRWRDVCACERCRLDMFAVAMNQLPARYVVSDDGHAHAQLDATHPQLSAQILTALNQAKETVRSKPSHG